jgi:hypothetical protein
VRTLLGQIVGVLLMLSSAAHSLLGWPQLEMQLDAAGVAADLQTGLRIGWHFGGAAMLAFGFIVLTVFTDRRRGGKAPLWAPQVISALYVAFGGWALTVSRGDLFFLIFVIPGLLLAVASFARRSS